MTQHTHDTAQFLWVEGPLSILEQLCLASFLHHGYSVHLYTYGEVTGVPDGVKILPGQDVLDEKWIIFNTGADGQRTSYTAFSDLFRLKLLLDKGGWWFDMDMICLQKLSPPSDFYVASTWEGEHGECACPCAMWAPKDDWRIRELFEVSRKIVGNEALSLGIPEAGVFPLQALIAKYDLHGSVAPWWEFCPYPWRLVYRLAQRDSRSYAKDLLRGCKHRLRELIDPRFKSAHIRPGTRTLHFHNEMWRACNLDKNESYCRFSLIERYKRLYLSSLAVKASSL